MNQFNDLPLAGLLAELVEPALVSLLSGFIVPYKPVVAVLSWLIR